MNTPATNPIKSVKARLPFAAMSVRGKHVSIVLAVAVHLLLLAFLFYGVNWQSQTSDTVEVDLVRSAPPLSAPAPLPSPEPPAKPLPAPEPKIESRPEPKPAPPLPKPDIAIKDNEKQKPLPKPDSMAESIQKQLAQELKQTSAARNAADLANAADRDLAQLKSAQASAAKDRAVADYIGKIRSKIRNNIILPADIKGNPEAVFDVMQLPSGEIGSVRLKKTSGHAGYDAAVERAILKSSPLPLPERNDLFARDLVLRFRPLEE